MRRLLTIVCVSAARKYTAAWLEPDSAMRVFRCTVVSFPFRVLKQPTHLLFCTVLSTLVRLTIHVHVHGNNKKLGGDGRTDGLNIGAIGWQAKELQSMLQQKRALRRAGAMPALHPLQLGVPVRHLQDARPAAQQPHTACQAPITNVPSRQSLGRWRRRRSFRASASPSRRHHLQKWRSDHEAKKRVERCLRRCYDCLESRGGCGAGRGCGSAPVQVTTGRRCPPRVCCCCCCCFHCDCADVGAGTGRGTGSAAVAAYGTASVPEASHALTLAGNGARWSHPKPFLDMLSGGLLRHVPRTGRCHHPPRSHQPHDRKGQPGDAR